MAERAKQARGPVTAKPKRPFAERNGEMMTPEEAADYLGVTERQVWRLLGRGDLPKIPVGRLVRLHREDIDAYIDRQREVAAE